MITMDALLAWAASRTYGSLVDEGRGAEIPYSNELQWGIDELTELLHYGRDSDAVTILDDESKRPHNQEWTKCLVADIMTDQGAVRIGYYSDGAQSVVDRLTDEGTVEDWAKEWDRDGLVPCYLWGEPEEEER